jgi:hypothetical protein
MTPRNRIGFNLFISAGAPFKIRFKIWFDLAGRVRDDDGR